MDMARAIHALRAQPKPSEAIIPGLLDGLDRIKRSPSLGWKRRDAAADGRVGVAAE